VGIVLSTKPVSVEKTKLASEGLLADKFVKTVGSWKFIISQSLAMSMWVLLNTFTPVKLDPYPYILLNLLLSTQAALLGPIILMSNNRQGDLDRRRDIDHYLLDLRERDLVEGIALTLEEMAKRMKTDEENRRG
jgi:uncharacterized membrane protein